MLVDFLNSNFFIALITLIVGGFAIGLYIKQKRDYKRDVASLILQEIRYAEQQVENARSSSPNANSYPLQYKLLPTNSWYKNIHLFINDFKQPNIDTISRFYAQTEYIDMIIKIISDYKASNIEQLISEGEKISREIILPDRIHLNAIAKSLMFQKNFQKEVFEQNEQSQTSNTIKNSNIQQTKILNYTLQLNAENILKEVSAKVKFIYNTPIGEKFNELSKKRWYNLL